MASPIPARPLVIGIGTDERSDDGVGLDVVRELRRRGTIPADIVEGPGDLTRLLDLWQGRERVVLIDATRSRATPGTIQRWDPDGPGPAVLGGAVSSHGISLADVLELARGLQRRPNRVTVYGIEAGSVVAGQTRSEGVRAAVPEVCRRISEEFSAGGGTTGDA